jgi:hypothetical protein
MLLDIVHNPLHFRIRTLQVKPADEASIVHIDSA